MAEKTATILAEFRLAFERQFSSAANFVGWTNPSAAPASYDDNMLTFVVKLPVNAVQWDAQALEIVGDPSIMAITKTHEAGTRATIIEAVRWQHVVRATILLWPADK